MIEDAPKSSLVCTITGKSFKAAPAHQIILAPALLKKDKNEWIVQKGTELGVSKLLFWKAERSEKTGFDDVRLAKIAKQATEQSERAYLPVIAPLSTLEEIISSCESSNKNGRTVRVVYLDMKAKTLEKIKNSTNDHEESMEICVFIGPEGGWTENERVDFARAGIEARSISENVLRAETAAIAVSSILSI